MTELLPCPFCGSPAEKTYKHILTAIPAITCSNEYCPAKPIVTGSFYESAMQKWNTRPDYAALKVAAKKAYRLLDSASKNYASVYELNRGKEELAALLDEESVK